VAAGGEAAAVAEDAGRCSDPDAGHRDQDLRKRAGFEEFLHAGREKLSLVKDGLKRDGEAEDDQRGSLGAGDDDGRPGAVPNGRTVPAVLRAPSIQPTSSWDSPRSS
jgi:hypothetical protein